MWRCPVGKEPSSWSLGKVCLFTYILAAWSVSAGFGVTQAWPTFLLTSVPPYFPCFFCSCMCGWILWFSNYCFSFFFVSCNWHFKVLVCWCFPAVYVWYELIPFLSYWEQCQLSTFNLNFPQDTVTVWHYKQQAKPALFLPISSGTGMSFVAMIGMTYYFCHLEGRKYSPVSII